jgi:apolipoprotein N-acyltransferase
MAIAVIPSVISLVLYLSIKPSTGSESEVVIVQPDYDPYTEKFTVPFEEQLEKAIEMAGESVTKNTDWLVFPETTVDDPINEFDMAENKYIRILKGLVNRYPGLNVVAGVVSYKQSQALLEAASPAGNNRDVNSLFKNYFNSAVKIDSGPVIQVYHKSKLVPGFETVFTSGPLRLVKKLLPELGGTNRGYEPQKERTCFADDNRSQTIAPVICYESIYGEFVTDYIKEGAEAIFVITNDGWWKNTNGYKQHFAHSSMRAIETRRPLVRSANTGISGIIDIKGKVIQKSDWWTPTVLKGVISPETRITFYVRFGDYLMYIAGMISLLILLMVFVYLPFRDKLR